jgi:hypothetical protein
MDWPPALARGCAATAHPWSHLSIEQRLTLLEPAAVEMLRSIERSHFDAMGFAPDRDAVTHAGDAGARRHGGGLADRPGGPGGAAGSLAPSMVVDDAELNRMLRGPQDGPEGPNTGSG